MNGGDRGGVRILLFSVVTLLKYNVSTILSPIVDGFMEESKEELDTDESLSGEDSDSLTENEECGD